MKYVLSFCLALYLLTGCATEEKNSPAKVWPHPVPCRIEDHANKDLFVMTLGDVQTSLADGQFDPIKDHVILKDGTVMENYYRETLGIKTYQPLDKSRFPVPPSGWCTWYYYYIKITDAEVMRNAKWIADNLKDYGARYVQIDDGWQGVSKPEGKRDWTCLREENFKRDMAEIADYIKSVGLTPGIWIAPHGQSNPEVVKANPNVFLLKPDGASASETWEGKFLVDPTTPESEQYMKDLFEMMCDWGYDYFKIDGQPIVVDEYRTKKQFMKHPDDDYIKLYRKTLRDMRSVIGPERYLLGCWGIPLEGIGIMNGSRTGGDIVLDWQGGFMLALDATLNHYYLHNIAWYCDPDVMLLRSPTTIEQARAWATLQGLTGQALMGTDRLTDLSDERVDIMRRVYPAVDIRPLDLFAVNHQKRMWDLKVNHLGRQYDVLGLFNYSEKQRDPMFVKWTDFDLPADKPIHVFDFWNKDYLGAWQAGMLVDIEPTSCRVLTVMPDNGQIQLISTNRHITQGWVDLIELKHDSEKNIFSGASRIIKDDPYVLRFAFPKGENFIIKSASAKFGMKKLPVKITNYHGWATVQIDSKKTKDVTWNVEFENAAFYPYPIEAPEDLHIKKQSDGSAYLSWKPQYWLNNGYQVYLDGKLLGYTPRSLFKLEGLDPDTKYTVEVETTWENGTVSKDKTKLEFILNETE